MHTLTARFVALAFFAPVLALAQAPNVITYQGRITNSGTSFTGTGQFRFAIYRTGPPVTSYWSHDSSSAGGAMPVTAVSLAVTGGLFAVGLGETTVPGMLHPIPPAIFSNSALRVRIWFSDGVVAPAIIADHPITSVGYAFLAMAVPDGSITSGKIASGAIGSTQLANDATFSQLRLDELGTETVSLDASTGAGEGALLTMRNGLGATTVLFDSDTFGERGSALTLFNSVGVGAMTLNADGIGESATLALRNSSNIETVQLLSSIGGGEGAVLYLRNGLSRTTLTLDADASGRASSITLTDADGDVTVFLDGDENNAIGGTIQVSNSAGVIRAELDGQAASGGGELVLSDADSTTTVNLRAAESATTGARLDLFHADGTRTVTLDAQSGVGGGAFELFESGGVRTVFLNSDGSGRAGVLGLYDGSGDLTVLIDADEGDGIGGTIQVFNSAGAIRAELDGQGASGGGELILRDEDGTSTVVIEAAEGAGNGAQIALYRAAGGGATIVLDADQGGEGRITTQVLEITGGSDFSENFDIRAGDAQPGMLVKIDAAHPGELAVADRAYDRAVAGVVSGAGGVKPGLVMGQRGTVADGKHPVALTGRVYCLVDAERGAIAPGDLITTSDTPGHGMKASDPARTHGAVIGKAMTGLARGRGLILVLVNLQ